MPRQQRSIQLEILSRKTAKNNLLNRTWAREKLLYCRHRDQRRFVFGIAIHTSTNSWKRNRRQLAFIRNLQRIAITGGEQSRLIARAARPYRSDRMNHILG